MAGDAETGVTIMRVVQALDAGPMMAKLTRAIDPQETREDVQIARLAAVELHVRERREAAEQELRSLA
jgi:methionyl-tRNA formyltransferase